MISNDRDHILLSFASVTSSLDNRIGLEPIIYYISDGNIFVGDPDGRIIGNKRRQLERLAVLLMEYIDQITPFFGRGYNKMEETLLSAQKKYNDIYLKKYILGKGGVD